MKQKHNSFSILGRCVFILVISFASCQKNDELSQPKKGTEISNEQVTTAKDEHVYYYSAHDKKLYVAEAYAAYCKTEFKATVISSEKWMINFPVKATVQVVLMKGETFQYTAPPQPADIRKVPRYKCTGSEDARDECTVNGSISVRAVTVPYNTCKRTGIRRDTCLVEYKLVGTGTAFNNTNCMGQPIGSAGIYKWACMD